MPQDKMKDLQDELKASQQAAADNLALANLSEEKCVELEKELNHVRAELNNANQRLQTVNTDLDNAASTIQDQRSNIDVLTQENQTLKQVNEQLSLRIESNIDALTRENETLKEVNDRLTEKIEELSKVKTLPEAAKEILEKMTPALPTETFKVKGQEYRFISPAFRFKKESIVASDIINNQDKLNELVEAGIGSIVKV